MMDKYCKHMETERNLLLELELTGVSLKLAWLVLHMARTGLMLTFMQKDREDNAQTLRTAGAVARHQPVASNWPAHFEILTYYQSMSKAPAEAPQNVVVRLGSGKHQLGGSHEASLKSNNPQEQETSREHRDSPGR